MAKMSVEGQLLLGAGVLVTLYIITRGRKLVTEDLNPASRENVIYSNLPDAPAVRSITDSAFATFDLLNPFASAERKQRAANFVAVQSNYR